MRSGRNLRKRCIYNEDKSVQWFDGLQRASDKIFAIKIKVQAMIKIKPVDYGTKSESILPGCWHVGHSDSRVPELIFIFSLILPTFTLYPLKHHLVIIMDMVAMLGVIYMDNGSDHHAHDFGDEKVILVTKRWKYTPPSPDEPILPKPSPLSRPFFHLSAFQLSQLCTHFLFVTIWGVTFQLIHFVHTS